MLKVFILLGVFLVSSLNYYFVYFFLGGGGAGEGVKERNPKGNDTSLLIECECQKYFWQVMC